MPTNARTQARAALRFSYLTSPPLIGPRSNHSLNECARMHVQSAADIMLAHRTPPTDGQLHQPRVVSRGLD